jgi:phage-related baseplate assembly protein
MTTAIDLSQLPPPEIVETLDFETILADLRAYVIDAEPDLAPALALESEPISRVIQMFAYREMLMRSRINGAAKGALLAYATGATLDHLGALFQVMRLAGEGDDALRRRIQSAFETFSVAGPRAAYYFNALDADGSIGDVGVTSPSPGVVTVTVLSKSPSGLANAAMLDAVRLRLNDDRVRPLTDQVVVQAAVPVPVHVTATLFIPQGPDDGLVKIQATKALDLYLTSVRKVGMPVAFSGIAAALHVASVTRVALSEPLGDIAITANQAPIEGDIQLTVEVAGNV